MFVATLALLGCLAGQAQAAFPGANGQIALTRGNGSQFDIWAMQPDGSGATNLTNTATSNWYPAWSNDGGKIAYMTSFAIHVMNADGSGNQPLTSEPSGWSAREPAWSPDRTKVAYACTGPGGGGSLCMINADGTGRTYLSTAFVPCGRFGAGSADAPSWSPDGTKIAYSTSVPECNGTDIYTIHPDGTNRTRLNTGVVGGPDNPDWSPDGTKIVFEAGGDLYRINAGGSGATPLTTGTPYDQRPAWSPDGTKIVFESDRDQTVAELYTMNPDGTDVTRITTTPPGTWNIGADWQPIPGNGYARPRGAGPLNVSLVPAYLPCPNPLNTGPSRVHGPPLAYGSCHPPYQASTSVTVGSPDANGAAANFVGSVRYGVRVGTPGAPEDSDVLISGSLLDVRCTAGTPGNPPCGAANSLGGPDYVGELEARVSMRMTDKWNGSAPGGGTTAATVQDMDLVAPLTCAATASTQTGASCVLTTAANGLVPGLVKDIKRSIWQMDRVRVFDGGPDGDVGTPGNGLFATQGIFVP